jgi:hypothetical protein
MNSSVVQATFKFDQRNQQNFERLWKAFDNGLAMYKTWFPKRPVFVVLDEITFLLPRPKDSEQLIKLKMNCLETICSLSIRHSLDQKDRSIYHHFVISVFIFPMVRRLFEC